MFPLSYDFPELYGPSELSIEKLVSFMSFLILTSSKTKNSGSGPKYAVSPIPVFFKYASAFFAIPLGSLSYGSLLTASKISQNKIKVL